MFIKILEVVSLIVGLVTASSWISEQSARQTDRVNQAWEIMAIDGPGNTGKIEALEYLNSWDEPFPNLTDGFNLKIQHFKWPKKKRYSLQGIDVSAEVNKSTYLKGVNLISADLSGSNFTRTNLERGNLSNSQIIASGFEDSILMGVNLSGANLSNSCFRSAFLAFANLKDTNLELADLTNATMTNIDNMGGAKFGGANLSNANFKNSNVDGVIFVGSTKHTQGLHAWYIKGKPPVGLKDLSQILEFETPPKRLSQQRCL